LAPSRTAGQASIRKVNKSIVLDLLRRWSPISRADLAARTGLNRSTITNIINYLIAEGLVAEGQQMDSKIGRPGIALTLKPDGGSILGLEIGVGFLSLILTDFSAVPVWRKKITAPPNAAQSEVLAAAEGLAAEALGVSRQLGLRPLGLGVGVPGLVNARQGLVVFAPNLGWRDVPLRQIWNQRFGLPVYIENEANLAALGEYYFGQAQGVENLIYLNSDVGLGAGVLLEGKLFPGAYGFAGEVGHIQRDPQGELCACGRRGCWETQVGPRAVLRRVQAALDSTSAVSALLPADRSQVSFDAVIEAALQGDPVCVQALQEVALHLGRGAADLANLFNPEMIVIGGALGRARSILQPVLDRVVPSEALQPAQKDLRLQFSSLGLDTCAFGAVAVVLNDILREIELV